MDSADALCAQVRCVKGGAVFAIPGWIDSTSNLVFVEIWNSISGNKQVSKFADRKKAVAASG